MKLFLLSLLSLLSVGAANECCLCDSCQPLEPTRESAYVFNDRTNAVNTCEELAWNLLEEVTSDSVECFENQSLFRSTCCSAAPLQEITRTEEQSRQLWGSSSWSVKPSTSSSYSSWGSNNQVTPTVSFRAPASTSSFSSPSRGSTCTLCNSMSNGSLGIVVNGPGFQFSGACRDLQNYMSVKGIGSNHQMCGATIARFRHDCGCGGPQNNAASFFGTAPNNTGLNSWCIKGHTC